MGPDKIGQPIDLTRAQAAEVEKAEEFTAAQVATLKETLLEITEEASNPLPAALRRAGKTVEEYKANLKESEKAKLEQKIAPPKELDDEAGKASEEHPELNKQTLLQLAKEILNAKSKEDILKIVKEFYQDPVLVNHA